TGNGGGAGVGLILTRGPYSVHVLCAMGSYAQQLAGYGHIGDTVGRTQFDQAWSATVKREAGLRIQTMFDAALDGSVEGLYGQGEDIVQADPNTQHVAAALSAMESIVVQDTFLNETAKYAHVRLPGSSLLEKDGTSPKAERRTSRARKVMPPPAGYAVWACSVRLA
ncbi:molybdopterin-dependent oxidoreductase, partial [Burkholderia cenocepacia]|uniref:molybdopterin-dependent oxidoreductase n=1 Tax=Burkholderia cenocepacia TaxID=95486 RepID=UPI00406BE4DA